MFSRELVAGLNAYIDRPWIVLHKGKEVTERWVSQQLSPYGIRPRTVWIGEISANGYMQGGFHRGISAVHCEIGAAGADR